MPKIVDHDHRRLEILDGCLSLFADHGYAKLSMRQLASSLGMTTGTLYHYFSSKKDIFEALFLQSQVENIRLVVSRFEADTTPDERLLILKGFVFENQERLRDILKIALEYQRVQSKEEASVILEAFDGYKAAFRTHLGVHDNAAELILSLIFGLLVQGIFDPNTDIGGQLEIIPNILSI